jgi:peptide/nickel transport system substrate-binding protein
MMMPRRRRASTMTPTVAHRCAAAIVGMFVAAGCAAPVRPSDTVVYASGADLESGNPLVTSHPLARQVQRYALFVTLARFDSTLVPVPYAARSWTWDADHRRLTMHLVGDLRWHDGEPTTAHDAAFTLEAARDPATGFPRASALVSLLGAEAVDDTTLVLRFATPQAELPSILCELAIAPRHLLGAVPRAELRRHPFGRSPVGNGPYRFIDRAPGQRWTFERNDAFPQSLGGPPTLRRIVVAVVDEATTKFAGLVSGELDVAGISPRMASLVERDPSLRVITYPFLLSTGLVFNTTKPPFDDARVRRGVNLSLRRERIIDVALAGYGIPAAGAVPPDSPLALPAAPAFDSLHADSLLDASGWTRGGDGMRVRGGTPFSIELLTVGSGDNAIEQLVQADLAARGIRVEIRQLELATFLARARETPRRFDLLLTGIPGELSLAHLASMYESRFAGGALDYAGFHDARLDTLFARARSATGPDDARNAWLDIQRLLSDEVPAAWIYHSRGVQGVSARLRGVTMDLRGEMATLVHWHVGG